ncbi:hypothetical protein HF996_00885 [Mycoplasma sp. 1654_15]|nr:hypothetical protein HF996_00885 [Mycoplasma sp. 1654_15]
MDTKVKEWEAKKQKIKTEYEALFTKLGFTSSQNEEELKNYVKEEKEKLDKKYKELADKIVLVNSQNGQQSEYEKNTFVPWEIKNNDKPLESNNLNNVEKYDSLLKTLQDYDSEYTNKIKTKLKPFTGLRNALAAVFGYETLSSFNTQKDGQKVEYIVPKEKLDDSSWNSGYHKYKENDFGFHMRKLEDYFVFGLDENSLGNKGDDLNYINSFISQLTLSLTNDEAIETKKNKVKQRISDFLSNILKDKNADINKLAEDFLYYYNTYLNLAIIKSELTKYTQTGFVPKKDTQQKSEIKFADFDQKVKEYDDLQAKLAKLKTENTIPTTTT